ncbi:MAG: DUF1565 domain-containing protein [Pleurocapsa sp.]
MTSNNYQTNHRLRVSYSWLWRGNQGIRLSLVVLIAALPSYIALQAQPTLAQEAIAQSPTLNKNIIYVNPQVGDDSQVGKKTSPLKTITQALKLADAGSTIQLVSGTYSEQTGETFPLVIQNQITLQGDPENQGYNTIIQGNGYFTSPTGAGQYVAIAAVEDAGGIIGVTVINKHSRGHGLWIESANPRVVSNTFTRNGNTGVSVNGNSSPTVEDNYFYNNSGNGLIVYGTSQPKVIDNTFENTGFGVSVVQNAATTLTKNTFDGNRIGIILEGNSQAVLRDNEIINSQESGLTAIAQSQVDLGTTKEAGNNTFRSNRKLDIQNAAENEILAVGTQTQGKTEGKINFDSGEFIARSNPTQNKSPLPPLPDLDRLPANTSLPAPTTPTIDTTADASLPEPPPVTDPNTSNKELVFTASSSAPPAETAQPEPVPFPPTISSSSVNPVKYKVLVEALDETEENEVRSLYPEAFKTIFQGKSWLQIGAFNQWDKAKQAERSLADLGLATYFLE